MHVSLVRLFVVCLCAALLSRAPTVRAEAVDPARSASARTLFDEGLKKADAEQWSEAADLFQRALALRDSAVIRFNLSSALIELGRLVEASEQLRTLELDPRATEELRTSARKNREGLVQRLSKLTIRVEGHDPSLLVLLDDRKVAPEQLGVAFPVDPMPHHVELRSGERLLDDEHVAPGEGQEVSVKLVGAVTLPMVAKASGPLVVGTALESTKRFDVGEPPAAVEQDRRKRRIWWGVGAGTVALAAGVVAAVLLAGHKSSSHNPSDPFSPGSVGVRVPQ